MPQNKGKPAKAVVLLSGGLDSATTLAIAREQGFSCFCLSVRYGQKQKTELAAAARVAKQIGAEKHLVLDLPLDAIGGSALTADLEVPKDRDMVGGAHDIPITYVPARNTIFLSIAVAWAEVLGAADIFIGVNAVDYSGYPDCRPEFIAAFSNAVNLGTRAGVEDGPPFTIHTPLITLGKKEIIREGSRLGVDYGLTHTCYDPVHTKGKVLACGRCDACRLRLRGFRGAGLVDPVAYADA